MHGRTMKRSLVFAACVSVAVAAIGCLAAAEQPAIAVTLNGSPVTLSTPPAILDGQLFLPLRELATLLGVYVSWIPEAQAVVLGRGDLVAGMRVGQASAEMNGQPVMLSAPPRLVQGTVMVPLRGVAAIFGAEVTYIDKAVSISMPPQAQSPLSGQFYRLIERYRQDALIGTRVWMKNYKRDRKMTVAPNTYSEGTIPVGHLEELEIVAFSGVPTDSPAMLTSPDVTRWVQVRNAKNQTGWFEIYDLGAAVHGFDYRTALQDLFFFSDPHKEHNWPASVWQLIEQNTVKLGMTTDMVLMSWGSPRRVHRSIDRFGQHEQWVYGDYGPYLYFENDKLTVIQD